LKNRLKILGIGLLVFGLINVFWYIPVSIILINQPFPFDYLQEVEIQESGFGVQIWYEPFEVIKYHPYWLVWSLSLYCGMIILSILGLKSLKQNTIS